MSLDTVIAAVDQLYGAIAGINEHYPDIPDLLLDTPNLITTGKSGEISYEPGQVVQKHLIRMWCRIAATDSPTAEKACRPFVSKFIEQNVKNVSINGTCQNSRLVRYEICRLPFGDTPYFGLLFDLEAEESETVEFSP